ncbi:MAG TPA: hypothetical protein VK173_05850, partial [Lacibacter sp.]|nr:hypothetical protein [Lacibacter sp.]
ISKFRLSLIYSIFAVRTHTIYQVAHSGLYSQKYARTKYGATHLLGCVSSHSITRPGNFFT